LRSLVVGATGLVGSHVAKALAQLGPVERTAHTRAGAGIRLLDIRDEAAVARVVAETTPDVVVCAAAEPFVERCEREPETTAAINVTGSANVARAAAEAAALVVFFSSDYVFDGSHPPYRETDPVRPLNEYGRQKVAAERIVAASRDHLICRTSGVFGVEPRRKNVVYQVIDRIARGERVRAADDQILCPTGAFELAEALVALIVAEARGIVHICGPDALTRAAFARLVANTFGLDTEKIDAVSTRELGLIARRPRDSSLRTERLEAISGRALPAVVEQLEHLRASGVG
jgi:dTDP-4-dehydrorhamnose reductase